MLLPGLDGTGEMFAPLVAELPPWIRPVVVSYPRDRPLGYEQLLPLAERALPAGGRFAILGESFGGPLAVMLAARRPPGLQALVLCATFVRKPFRTLPASAAALCFPPLFRLWPPLLRLRTWPHRREFGGLLAWALATIRTVRPEAIAARARAVLRVDVEAELRATTLPLLVVRAGRDALIRPHNAGVILRARPDARLAVIDTLHFVLQLEPRRSAQEIAGFLASLPA